MNTNIPTYKHNTKHKQITSKRKLKRRPRTPNDRFMGAPWKREKRRERKNSAFFSNNKHKNQTNNNSIFNPGQLCIHSQHTDTHTHTAVKWVWGTSSTCLDYKQSRIHSNAEFNIKSSSKSLITVFPTQTHNVHTSIINLTVSSNPLLRGNDNHIAIHIAIPIASHQKFTQRPIYYIYIYICPLISVSYCPIRFWFCFLLLYIYMNY